MPEIKVPSNPNDLRHITSNAALAPPIRDRQTSGSSERSGKAHHPSISMTVPRLGSRSPVSIPSSPTSVHSSSSAIFERDIEPSIISPTHPLNQPLSTHPHRTPRSKVTEQIDSSVPSVLDSAIEMLNASGEDDLQIAVEAPLTLSPGSRRTSALGSPIGPGSRSPSPTTSVGNRTSMLLHFPGPTGSAPLPLSSSIVSVGSRSPSSTGSPTRPSIQTSVLNSNMSMDGNTQVITFPPRSATPTSASYGSATSSPTTTTMEHPPQPLQTLTPAALRSSPSPPLRPTAQFSHPPSPSNGANKRLSFVSYNDLLTSTPTATQPLSSLTMPLTSEPPPHIPPVSISFSSAPGSVVGSAAASIMDGVLGLRHHGATADVREPSGGVIDDVGGEWEREGLGRGLEERLEALQVMPVGPEKV